MARYETKEEYLARIQPTIFDSVLVNYETIDRNGETISQGVVGDWRDIALADGNEVTSVITIDLASDAPKLGTSETILGGWMGNSYVSDSSIYLTSNVVENARQIVHLDLADSEGQLTADAVGSVKGIIRNSRFMDEFEDKLRVVTTEDGFDSGGRIRNSANLFVLQVEDGALKTVGELLDISPGDQAYAAEFDGPRAVITTGYINPVTMIRPLDPLHGIDLSAPTHPKELSDLVIPGITNYVHWVDSDHLIGVGVFEENSLWYAHVSLYDVTDLAAPKTLDVWHGTKPIQPNLFGAPNALDIHFDPVSKTLTIPQEEHRAIPQNWLWSRTNEDSIFWDPRTLQVQTASDVLANDSHVVDYTITAIKGSQLRGTVRILPDQRLEYTNPTDLKTDKLSWSDRFSYEVTTKDGAKFESMVWVYGQRKTVINHQTTALIVLKGLDAEDNLVTSTAKGDEFWVEVQVQAGNSAPG